MKKRGRGWISILFITLTLAVIIVYGIISGELKNSWYALQSSNISYLTAAIGCMAAFVILRAAMLIYYINHQNRPLRFTDAVRVTLVGLYYSGITPAATGGQPMQIYELNRSSIVPSIGSSAILVETFGFEIPEGCAPTYVSRQKPTRKRGRPPKKVVERNL